jgi:hypothetical protein
MPYWMKLANISISSVVSSLVWDLTRSFILVHFKPHWLSKLSYQQWQHLQPPQNVLHY